MKFVVSRSSGLGFFEECPPVPGAVLEQHERPGFGYAKEWMSEVPDLEAALKLAREQGGRLILFSESHLFPHIPQIEIYDDYRE